MISMTFSWWYSLHFEDIAMALFQRFVIYYDMFHELLFYEIFTKILLHALLWLFMSFFMTHYIMTLHCILIIPKPQSKYLDPFVFLYRFIPHSHFVQHPLLVLHLQSPVWLFGCFPTIFLRMETQKITNELLKWVVITASGTIKFWTSEIMVFLGSVNHT